jgi:hypothetical protein
VQALASRFCNFYIKKRKRDPLVVRYAARRQVLAMPFDLLLFLNANG